MRIRNAAFSGLCFALVLGLSTSTVGAQSKAQKSTKMESTKMDKAAGKTTNLQGTVENIDQGKSMITVMVGKAARPFIQYRNQISLRAQ